MVVFNAVVVDLTSQKLGFGLHDNSLEQARMRRCGRVVDTRRRCIQINRIVHDIAGGRIGELTRR